MKRALIVGLFGALVFALLSTWLGPSVITWFVTPADQPAVLSCQHAVEGALRRLITVQFVATCAGFVIGLILGIAFRRKAPPASPPPAPAKV